MVSAKAVTQRSKGQASSPHVEVDRAKSVNSSKNKQMRAYDAEYTGNQLAAQGGGGQSHNNGDGGNQGGRKGDSAGRGYPPRHPGPNQNQPQQGQQMVVQAQQQGGGQAGNRYNGNSAMARAGYQAYDNAVGTRLGPWTLDPDD